MNNNSLGLLYQEMHPALKNLRLLYWHEIITCPPEPIVLFGDELSCNLFQKRFEEYRVPVSGLLIWDSDSLDSSFITCGADARSPIDLKKSFVVVSLRDYPRDVSQYLLVSDCLARRGVENPYIIHEFSSGFSLGAENVVPERNDIERAFTLLSDENSKQCLLSFLKNATTPFHWNMDFTAETFGISDPRRFKDISHDEVLSGLQELNSGYILYCNNNEFNKNDPKLSVLDNNSAIFCANPLTRLKMREYLSKRKGKTSIPIIDSVLWDQCGKQALNISMVSGGTPLSYDTSEQVFNTITIDSLRDELLLNLDAIVLDMGNDYINAILGAKRTICKSGPLIIVDGFKRAEQLWNAILELAHCLPDYDITLRRYSTENLLEGHSIILKKGDKV